jgi:hypothetical protein
VDLVHEATTFGRHLAGVGWPALGVALGLHLARRAARARAWQNLVHGACPDERLPYGVALASCFAALGLAALSPVRGAELVRVALVKRWLRGASTITLAGTLAAEAVVDAPFAAAVLAAALALGLLPAVPGLPGLADALAARPELTAAGCATVVLLTAGARLGGLGARIQRASRLGFAAVRDPRVLLGGAAPWLALSWILRLASVSWFLRAFGVDAAPEVALAVVACQLASTAIPLAWAGVGAQQALLVLALAGSASTTTALAVGLGMQAATLAANVGAGLIGLGLLARRARPPYWRTRAGAAVQP